MRPWLSLAGSGLLLLTAPAPPPRLGIQPHTVRPRYAYRLGARALRVQRDCHRPGRTLVQLRIQVINRGTRRVELPVLLRAGLARDGAEPVRVPVPAVAPGGVAWVRIEVPYASGRDDSPGIGLQVALTAAGQSWNRLRLPAPGAAVPCPRPRERGRRHTGSVAPVTTSSHRETYPPGDRT